MSLQSSYKVDKETFDQITENYFKTAYELQQLQFLLAEIGIQTIDEQSPHQHKEGSAGHIRHLVNKDALNQAISLCTNLINNNNFEGFLSTEKGQITSKEFLLNALNNIKIVKDCGFELTHTSEILKILRGLTKNKIGIDVKNKTIAVVRPRNHNEKNTPKKAPSKSSLNVSNSTDNDNYFKENLNIIASNWLESPFITIETFFSANNQQVSKQAETDLNNIRSSISDFDKIEKKLKDKIIKLKDNIKKIQNEKDNLFKDLLESEDKLKEALNENKTQSDKIRILTSELEQNKNSLGTLNLYHKNLEQDQKHAQEIMNKYDKLEKSLNEKIEELEALQNLHNGLKEESDHKDEQIQKSLNLATQYETLNKEFSEQIDIHKKLNDKLKTEHENIIKKLEEERKEILANEIKLNEQVITIGTQKEELEKQLNELKKVASNSEVHIKKIATLERDLDHKTQELNAAKEELKTLNENNTGLNSQLKQFETELSSLKTQNNEKLNELDSLKSIIAGKDSSIVKLTVEKAITETNLNHSNERIQELQTEIKDIIAEKEGLLNELKKDIHEKETLLQSLNEKNSALNSEKTRLETEFKTHKEQSGTTISILENKIKTKKEKIRLKKEEIIKLKENNALLIAENKKSLESLDQQTISNNNLIKSLNEQITDLENQLKDYGKDESVLKTEVNKLNSTLDLAKEQHQKLIDENAKLKAKKDRLKDEILKQITDYNNQTQTLRDLTNDLKRLEQENKDLSNVNKDLSAANIESKRNLEEKDFYENRLKEYYDREIKNLTNETEEAVEFYRGKIKTLEEEISKLSKQENKISENENLNQVVLQKQIDSLIQEKNEIAHVLNQEIDNLNNKIKKLVEEKNKADSETTEITKTSEAGKDSKIEENIETQNIVQNIKNQNITQSNKKNLNKPEEKNDIKPENKNLLASNKKEVHTQKNNTWQTILFIALLSIPFIGAAIAMLIPSVRETIVSYFKPSASNSIANAAGREFRTRVTQTSLAKDVVQNTIG